MKYIVEVLDNKIASKYSTEWQVEPQVMGSIAKYFYIFALFLFPSQ